jgi:1-phosphofructokinase
VVNEPGPTVTATEWALLADTVRNLCTSADWLTISGSLPTGVGPTDLQALVTSIAPRSRVALDTSGAPLRGMLTAPIALLKINRSELADATGLPLTDHGAIVAAARTLCAAGPQAVVITLGAAGALAVDSRGAWHISAPHIVARSPVGSGDCMLAGLVAALVDGAPLAEAVAAGVAAGSANALVPYAGVFDPAVAAAFRRDATITRLG